MNDAKPKLLIAILVVCIVSLIVGVTAVARKGDSQQRPAAKKKDKGIIAQTISGIQGPKVIVLHLNGPISMSRRRSFMPAPGSAQTLRFSFKQYAKDDSVKGFILRINSPGGTVAATQEIAATLRRIRESGKKVVVLCEDICASGGYYIASQADSIIAYRGSIVGSIGVIIASLNFHELLRKYGVRENVIKSGPYKDILSPSRRMTATERALLQQTIDDVYQQFFDDVLKGRKMSKRRLRQVADGRILSGRQALRHQLIDKVGNMGTAVETIKAYKSVGENVKIIDPSQKRYGLLKQFFYNKFGPSALERFLTSGFSSPVLYLYRMRP